MPKGEEGKKERLRLRVRERDEASAEKGAFPLSSVAPPVGRLGKGFPSPTVAAILFLPGRELWRCYGLFTFFGWGSRAAANDRAEGVF